MNPTTTPSQQNLLLRPGTARNGAPSQELALQPAPAVPIPMPSLTADPPVLVSMAVAGVPESLAPVARHFQGALLQQTPSPIVAAIPRPLPSFSLIPKDNLWLLSEYNTCTPQRLAPTDQVPEPLNTAIDFNNVDKAVAETCGRVEKLLALGKLEAAHSALEKMGLALTPAKGGSIGRQRTKEMDVILAAVEKCKHLPLQAHVMGAFHHFGDIHRYISIWRRALRHQNSGTGHVPISLQDIVRHYEPFLRIHGKRVEALQATLVLLSWVARPWNGVGRSSTREALPRLVKDALSTLDEVLQLEYAEMETKLDRASFRADMLAAFDSAFCSRVLSKALLETPGLWREPEQERALDALQNIVIRDGVDFFALKTDLLSITREKKVAPEYVPVVVQPGPKRKREREQEELEVSDTDVPTPKRSRKAEVPDDVMEEAPAARRTRAQTRTQTRTQTQTQTQTPTYAEPMDEQAASPFTDPVPAAQPVKPNRNRRERQGVQFKVLARSTVPLQPPINAKPLLRMEDMELGDVLGELYRYRDDLNQLTFREAVKTGMTGTDLIEPDDWRINNKIVDDARVRILQEAALDRVIGLRDFLDNMQILAALPRGSNFNLSVHGSVVGVLRPMVNLARLCASGASVKWTKETQFWSDVVRNIAGPRKAALREGMRAELPRIPAHIKLPQKFTDALSH